MEATVGHLFNRFIDYNGVPQVSVTASGVLTEKIAYLGIPENADISQRKGARLSRDAWGSPFSQRIILRGDLQYGYHYISHRDCDTVMR